MKVRLGLVQVGWLPIVLAAIRLVYAQMAPLNDERRALLSNNSPIIIVATAVSSVKLVDQEKKKTSLPPEYRVGSLTTVGVNEVLRADSPLKPNDRIQIFVETQRVGMDVVPVPPLVIGRQYLLMLSPVAPDDPRLNPNVVIDAPSAPPIVRTNLYGVPLGAGAVVNIVPAQQNLVNLIRLAVKQKKFEELRVQRQP